MRLFAVLAQTCLLIISANAQWTVISLHQTGTFASSYAFGVDAASLHPLPQTPRRSPLGVEAPGLVADVFDAPEVQRRHKTEPLPPRRSPAVGEFRPMERDQC